MNDQTNINWPVYHFKNVTQQHLDDPNFLTKGMSVYNSFKAKRSEVIEAALSVEGILDMVLLDLFAGKDDRKREIFRELILFPEFCSSIQKWKMLRSLMTVFPHYFESISEARGSTLRNEIHSLMGDRNKFAHGDLFVDANDFTVEIRYYENGTKHLPITDEFLADLFRRAKDSSDELSKLHNRFTTLG